MLELKFKAWLKNEKRMVNPLAIYWQNGKIHHIVWDAPEENIYYGESDDFVLMLYTGLNDIYGNPAYEGDVIKVDEGEYACIKYDEENARFITEELFEEVYITENLEGYFGFEIVGNIYEDPDFRRRYTNEN